MVTVKSDAGQKYQNTLLERFDIGDITYLKRASWGGIVTETDRLYSTMLHDWDVLQKDSNDIEKAVKSLDWSIVPYVQKGEKVTPIAEEVAKTVEDALWHRSSMQLGEFGHSFSQLLGVLCHAVFRGQNVHQIVWKNEGELIYPARFEQLAPQFLQWEMEPGKVDRLLLVPDGEGAKPVPFPQYKFIVALNNSGPDHPLYNATYYSLVAWFAAAKKGLGWFMEFCQQYGLPKPVFHYDNPEDKMRLINDLSDKRVINALLLEGDRQVDWAQVPASGQSLPQRELLTMAEAAVHKAMLGQTLTSEAGGSLAQAKVHAGVQADTVMRYAEFVAEVVNQQLIPAIVHLNYGRVDVPMPELRCKLPQAVANIERAQFWGHVLQIPGMQVVKSDVYDSLGIAMPGEGDDVLQAPSQDAQKALLEGLPDNKKKDELALAARAKEEEPKGIEGWLAPLKKKLIEAKRNGASFAELKQMMLEAQLNTRALAGAFAENIKSGFMGEGVADDDLEAAKRKGNKKKVKAEKQHVKGCNQHECQQGCSIGYKGLLHPAQWNPIIMPNKITAKEARLKLEKGIHVKNPLGEEVTLDDRILNHWDGANKKESDINTRLAALPLIVEVVKNPAEIWEDEKGKRTYLASVIDPYDTQKRYTVAFTQDEDNTVIETYWTDSKQIEAKRVGKKLYESAVVSGT